jgi:AcrR family transcriptional regulator
VSPLVDTVQSIDRAAAKPAERGLRGRTARSGRLSRVHRAALELAREGGYRAVTMARVAERAGVSRANLYQHYFSRDDLICAAFAKVHWVAPTPPEVLSSSTPLDRTVALLDQLLQQGLDNPGIAEAVALAAARAQESTLATVPDLHSQTLHSVIGDALPPERAQDAVVTLVHVINSVMLRLARPDSEPERARAVLRAAARAVLVDASDDSATS